MVGTPFKENSNDVYNYRFVGTEHVSGACQLFRRECFEEIGGYVPVKDGGVDLIAVVSARMKGWKTKTFTHTWFQLHREMGAVHGQLLGAPQLVSRTTPWKPSDLGTDQNRLSDH